MKPNGFRQGARFRTFQRPGRLGREQVAVVDHAQDLAGRGQDGSVMQTAVEQVQQDIAAKTVSADSVDGSRHDGGDGLVGADACSDDA
jgi:hypothetical protein